MWLLETGTANFERLTGFNHEEERGMSPCFHLCHTKNPQGFFLNLSIPLFLAEGGGVFGFK